MKETPERTNRRSFLKKSAITGAFATGVTASVDTVAADSGDCKGFVVKGYEDGTNYSIQFNDWSTPEKDSYYCESEESVYGSMVSGQVDSGEVDYFWVEQNAALRLVDIEGKAIVCYDNRNCDPVYGTVPDPIEIDIDGYGDYTFGWWDDLRAGNNLESEELEYCVPTYSDTGDPQLTCVFDQEGVIRGEVQTPHMSEPQEYDFGTGQVSGYTDTFYVDEGTFGAGYFRADGDVVMDVTKQ